MTSYVKSLSNKKNGLTCYECNSDFDFPLLHFLGLITEEPKVCKSCERDRRVDFLINPFKSKYYNFDKIFFNSKFDKYLSILLFITIGLIVFDISMIFFDIRVSSIPNNILLTIYWCLMIYRVKVVMRGTSKK